MATKQIFLLLIFLLPNQMQPQVMTGEDSLQIKKYWSIDDTVIIKHEVIIRKILEVCSLSIDRVKEGYDYLDSVRIFENWPFCVGYIEDSIIIKHRILIVSYFRDNKHAGLTFIADADGKIKIFLPDSVRLFNQMMLAESIQVNSYDKAVDVAKLYIRMVAPRISTHLSYFYDELTDSTYDTFMARAGRSELNWLDKNLARWSPTKNQKEYQACKKLHAKDMAKRKWYTRVSKKYDIYTVNTISTEISYTCLYLARGITEWEITVFSDGTIKVKKPKFGSKK